MNIKEYISSGIIESFVLGFANTEEITELQKLALQHSEIREAIIQCQESMEILAEKHAEVPPIGLKEAIWSKLQEHSIQDNSEILQEDPINISQKELSISDSQKKMRWIYYLTAASIAGLIFSVGLNFFYSGKNVENTKQLVRLKTTRDSLLIQNNLYRSITGPNVNTVLLSGVGSHQQNKVTVYWNKESKKVYLTVNNLPLPPKGKQYQLWAIRDGKPVNAGLIDSKNIHAIQKLLDIEAAQMFAITLEPVGGSISPTLDQMFVAGKI